MVSMNTPCKGVQRVEEIKTNNQPGTSSWNTQNRTG